MTTADDLINMKPDKTMSARDFGVASDMKIPAFSKRTEYVPEVDEAYRFDPQTTLAILGGFAFNRRVMVQGYHGTGKST
ncbi:MAG TPA: cobaltochelatase subunit CobS, partial [Caulobacterales bacterium]|nr:cobaltochelatase subunit CobS [Caulobacterales bacterium]